MGLCKCPKKKVTSQFCFEHKVNVCEHCIVNNHQMCIVGPYLQWLEDSSYQSVCSLCQQSLSSNECIRLICYHIFHLKCINHFASNFPLNTAPAGYVCPTCQRPMFGGTSTSPVASAFQKTLGDVSWARAGFGFPLVDSANASFEEVNNSSKTNSQTHSPNNHQYHVPQVVHHTPAVPTSNVPIPVNAVASFITSSDNMTIGFTSSARNRDFDHDSRKSLLDIDEDKYRTKSPMEFLSRWWRSHSSGFNRRKMPKLTYRRWIVLAILLIIGLCTIIHLFLKMGRESAERDPMLDPRFNPNIRNEGGDEGFKLD